MGPDGQICPSEILHRPKPLEPAQVHLLLGADRPLPWHQASRTAMYLNSMLRRGISLLDRTNSVGVRDCLLVHPGPPASRQPVVLPAHERVCACFTAGTCCVAALVALLSSAADHGALCVQVQTRVPAGSIQTAGAAFSLFDESAGSTDLAVIVQSDFQEVRLPLKVHGGASWVVSDLAYLRSKALRHVTPRSL